MELGERFIHYPLNPPMSAKKGVELDRLLPPLRQWLAPMSYLWKAFFMGDLNGMTITSGHEGVPGDGVHGKDSLHYKGHAVDLRVRDVDNARAHYQFVQALKILLGKDYDIVWEGDHIHVEYDPEAIQQNIPSDYVVAGKATAGTTPGTGSA